MSNFGFEVYWKTAMCENCNLNSEGDCFFNHDCILCYLEVKKACQEFNKMMIAEINAKSEA